MKKKSTKGPHTGQGDNALPEYDFSKGQRNRYASALKEQGYTIRVYERDGTFSERHVLPEATVTLEPDIREHFPDSESVNTALRKIISLFPKEQPAKPGRRLSGKGSARRKRE